MRTKEALGRLESKFESTSMSVSDLLDSYSESGFHATRSPLSGSRFPILERSRAPVDAQRIQTVMSELMSIERDYRKSSVELKRDLTLLNKRFSAARRILDEMPEIKQSEYDNIEKLELRIDQAAKVLGKTDLDELEKSVSQESDLTAKLEKTNRERRERLKMGKIDELRDRSAFKSAPLDEYLLAKQRLALLFERDGRSVSISDVKAQIRDLIEALRKRKASQKERVREIDNLEKAYMRKRTEIENGYSTKQETLNRLQEKYDEITSLQLQCEELVKAIASGQQRLKETIRNREQIERQNYTAARDKHSNSEAARRLRAVTKRYKDAKRAYKFKAVQLAKLRAQLEEQEREVVAQEEKAAQYDAKVEALIRQLAQSGIDFAQKLNESQSELDRLDLLASQRSGMQNKSTFEEEISAILAEA